MLKTIISRVQRLNTPFPHEVLMTSLDVPSFQKESIVVDGRILNRTLQVSVNVRDVMSKFNAQDFQLENILAIGASDHLRPISSLVSNDIDTSLLSLDSVMDLVDVIDAKKASKDSTVETSESSKLSPDA